MKNSISRISFVSFIASFFLPAVFCLQTLSAQYSGSSASSGVVTLNSTNAWNKVFITDRAVNTNVQTGSPFISNEWQLANIVVMENKGEIQNVPVRIDAKYSAQTAKSSQDLRSNSGVPHAWHPLWFHSWPV